MVDSPSLKDRAAVRSAKYVVRDIGSTFSLADVAICWPAKTVDATECRHGLSSSRFSPYSRKRVMVQAHAP